MLAILVLEGPHHHDLGWTLCREGEVWLMVEELSNLEKLLIYEGGPAELEVLVIYDHSTWYRMSLRISEESGSSAGQIWTFENGYR